MRGESNRQETFLSLWTPEQRVPADHPIRKIKKLADQELKRLSPVFDTMYSHTGRPSVPPERVLKALLLMALYSVRSERQMCEQLDYNLLFRWFLDMNPIEDSFDATVFSDRTVAGHQRDSGRYQVAVVSDGAEVAETADCAAYRGQRQTSGRLGGRCPDQETPGLRD